MTEVLAAVVREEWGRLIALLLARYRRLDLVEDALADAVEAAARTWPDRGTPDSPTAWLMTAARRRVLDRLRAETIAQRKMPLLAMDAAEDTAPPRADPGGLVADERLRLVLMTAHPALAPEAATALALRLVLGVNTADIARLFLVSEPTMAARLTRAKKKIVAARIPFAVPDASVLPDRLDTVAQTAYLGFTAGYAPGTGADLLRADLAAEAVRLVRVVLALRPHEPVLVALLALMLLQHSRRDARVGGDGALVLLADQDRTRWHRDEIDEGLEALRSPALFGPVTPTAAAYTLQARIAAEHACARTAAETDWGHVVQLYDVLVQLSPGPPTRLARAVALAEYAGPAAGLRAIADLEMPGSHRLEAVRGDLLSRDGRTDEARAAYRRAVELCRNDTERDHLRGRLAALGG